MTSDGVDRGMPALSSANGQNTESGVDGSSVKQQAAVAELGQLALSGVDLPLLFQSAARLVLSALGAGRCSIRMLRADGRLETMAEVGESRDSEDEHEPDAACVTDLSSPDGYAIRSRSPVFASAGVPDPRFGDQFVFENGRNSHGLWVPVPGKDAPVGVMCVYTSSRDRFSQSDLHFTQALAHVISQAVERKELEALLRRKAEERGVLAEIGRVIGSSLQVDQVYERFAELVQRLVPWDRITISTIDSSTETVQIAYTAGVDLPGRHPGSVLPLADTPAHEAFTSRSGLILNGERADQLVERYPVARASLDAGLISMLCVPLEWRDRVIGVLVLQSARGNAYSEGELALAERVGHQIAGAIANAELHAELSRHAYTSNVIAEIGRVVASSLHLQEMMPRFTSNLRRLIQFDGIEVTEIDQARQSAMRVYAEGLTLDNAENVAERAIAGTPTGLVARNRTAVILGPASLRPGSSQDEVLSVLAIPLGTRGDVTGALCLYSRSAGAYGDHDLATAENIAMWLSPAIANAEMHATLERQAQDNELLASIASETRPGMRVEDICLAFHDKLADRLELAGFQVTAIDHATNEELCVYSRERGTAEPRGGRRFPLRGSVTFEVMRTRRGFVLAENEPPGDLASGGHSFPPGSASAIVVPLMFGGRVAGALQLYGTQSSASLARDLPFATKIAEQFSRTAIPNREIQPWFGETDLDVLPWAPQITEEYSWARDPAGTTLRDGTASVPPSRAAIVIVDRQPICRDGLRALFDGTGVEVLGVASDFHAASGFVAQPRPKVVLYEKHSGDLTGFDSAGALQLELHQGRLLVLAEEATKDDVIDALRIGASGFVLKTLSRSGLVHAVQRVASGGTVVEPDLLTAVIAELRAASPAATQLDRRVLSALTDRDRTILSALANGRTNAEIAAALNLSVGSVKNQMTRLYRQIGVRDRSAAAALAIRAGVGR